MIEERAKEVAAALGSDDRRVLDELCEDIGRGPTHISAVLNCTRAQARATLQNLEREGVVEYGSLVSDDDGLLRGRGYWISPFGRHVKESIS